MKKRKGIAKRIVGILLLAFVLSSNSFAQSIDQKFFNDVDALLKTSVKGGMVDYTMLKNEKELPRLIQLIGSADLTGLDEKALQAFYINAYNLNVINQIVENYPIKSVMDTPGFFDRNKITVANKQLTLNNLEKENLLAEYNDARFHFVLVCGANGCPPITNFAYTPDKLESQLEQQTKLALEDNSFIRVQGKEVELSQIFKWYPADFGNSKENIISFINKYRKSQISNSAKISYYNYDWSLNDLATGFGNINTSIQPSNESRYVVSSVIPKGSFEFKFFNNLYSQQIGDVNELRDRNSFFTTSLSALYGLNKRLNVGLVTRFRKVRNNPLPSSPFTVFGSGDDGSSRSGITAIGPQIRYAPNLNWKNFSIQSSFVFAIGQDLDGGDGTGPYIDWDGPTWNTQFFNDFSIGSKFSLFTEFDLLIEDIGPGEEGHVNRFSTPVTVIFSFIPTNKFTIYTLAGYSPYWQSEYDYFAQFGLGSKYQFTPKVELELLYTDFSNKFLNTTGGQAETINLGLRINI